MSEVQPSSPSIAAPVEPTLIDCGSCVVRGLACHDCVVTVLLGPPEELSFDHDQSRALAALAAGGLVPPLRMVQPVSAPLVEDG